jgi:hypothetical protein
MVVGELAAEDDVALGVAEEELETTFVLYVFK